MEKFTEANIRRYLLLFDNVVELRMNLEYSAASINYIVMPTLDKSIRNDSDEVIHGQLCDLWRALKKGDWNEVYSLRQEPHNAIS